MIIKLTFLFILIFSSSVSAEEQKCSITLYSKVYRLDSSQELTANDIAHKTDCDINIVNKISQIISISTGTVGIDFLKRELKKEFPNQNLEINPRKMSLLELNSTLRDQLANETNLYFLDSKSLNGIKTLGLVENEQLKSTCESCNSFGEKNIKIDIVNPMANSTRTLWFSSKIMAKIKVFKAKRNISFQQAHLEATDFYQDEIYTGNPENVLTSIDNIHFFKANRTIIQGAAVSNLDLQPVNLINYGTPVNVLLKNQNINLQRTAMPSRSAQFGETIELKNPSNNKIIAGRVVDYNKVVIEL